MQGQRHVYLENCTFHDGGTLEAGFLTAGEAGLKENEAESKRRNPY